ncbi:hypothetical protein GGR50DRAFT_669525 [Xylaria sp. CBS 124048]|nr:hypothetical protein GGR50DRAFT_669525 [Xylaria sp. CBS 124048]
MDSWTLAFVGFCSWPAVWCSLATRSGKAYQNVVWGNDGVISKIALMDRELLPTGSLFLKKKLIHTITGLIIWFVTRWSG